MPNDITHFVRRWQASQRTERSGYQEHFRDLCEALDVSPPSQADEIGHSYAFERRVTKAGGGEGFGDVWRRGWFAWEYKSKGGDLGKAYRQLNEYHEALDNPPLLIVCDFERFEVHTKFENLPSRVFKFTLNELLHNRDTADCALPPLEVLRNVFGDYNQLRPNVTAPRVTEAAAKDFLKLAQQLERERAAAPQPASKEQIAHFLMRLVFCLFADSVGLLPNHTFRQLIANHRHSPKNFNRALPDLFGAMSEEDALFGPEKIPFFNGGLFRLNDTYLELNHADLGILASASQHDWSNIEPAIFGTLFERSLDAAKRSMIGAHYTSPDDILLLIEPVIIDPLRRRWEARKAEILTALAEERTRENANGAPPYQPGASPQEVAPTKIGKGLKARPKPVATPQTGLPLHRPALDLLQSWAAELSAVRVLDPACGSGNFLYLALKRLLDLWHEARSFGVEHGLSLSLDPIPSPAQLFGIERDFYAHEIASVVVWIGFLQWKRDHNIKDEREPILRKLDNIEHNDAILRYDETGKPYEPAWPEADYIVSNPPFLGDKKMRRELNAPERPAYVDQLRNLYDGRVPGGADLVTFWFEKAREQIQRKPDTRAGLLATNSISMVGNRPVLKRINETGAIFMAWSDRPWILEGAAVRVALIGFDSGSQAERTLDGKPVLAIHSDLTAESKLMDANALAENENLCFLGVMKGGPFDIAEDQARKMLEAPVNVNKRPNSDVLKRRVTGQDIVGRDRQGWLIDFKNMSEDEAAFYQWPFEYVRQKVKPLRDQSRDKFMRTHWWRHGRSRPAFWRALGDAGRYIATPEVAKHRVFAWQSAEVIPDHTCHVIARADDYFFGLLQSRPHVIWTLKVGSTLEDRPRYTSDLTFLTFPFPWPPGTELPEDADPRVKAIADAARELVRLRDNWLNPPDASEADLKHRTLTKLYNLRAAGQCTWLENAHRALDRAVFAAYGWPEDPAALPNQEILARLLALNGERAKLQEP